MDNYLLKPRSKFVNNFLNDEGILVVFSQKVGKLNDCKAISVAEKLSLNIELELHRFDANYIYNSRSISCHNILLIIIVKEITFAIK